MNNRKDVIGISNEQELQGKRGKCAFLLAAAHLKKQNLVIESGEPTEKNMENCVMCEVTKIYTERAGRSKSDQGIQHFHPLLMAKLIRLLLLSCGVLLI